MTHLDVATTVRPAPRTPAGLDTARQEDARNLLPSEQPLSIANLTLPLRFGIIAALVILIGMAALGPWVSSRIQAGVTQHAAQQTAYDMEALLEPVAVELEQVRHGPLSAAGLDVVNRVIEAGAPGAEILGLRLWSPDLVLLHSTSRPGLSSNKIDEERHADIAKAIEGMVIHRYRAASAAEATSWGLSPGSKVNEIFAPLRSYGGRGVVAVAEYFQSAEALDQEVAVARRETWMMVLMTGLVMLGILYWLVHRGSAIFEAQNAALDQRMRDQKLLAEETQELNRKLEQASRLGTELNERFLRRVGSDLHDGPAQHLALAMLKMDEVAQFLASNQRADKPAAIEALGLVRHATSEAMKEIRNISAGLALPELQKLSPAEALNAAARQHERATGTHVKIDIAPLPPRLPLPITICLYRFAQESLNNAYRHARGQGQELNAHSDGRYVDVEIADSGPGFTLQDAAAKPERLGLSGLRQRIEALGGTFELTSTPGQGTRVRARFETPSIGGRRG